MKTIKAINSQQSRSLLHPEKGALPRAMFNPDGNATMHDDEATIVSAAAAVGLECQYEPFLFQMWDEQRGGRLGTAPDLWLPSLNLIVEIGQPETKSRKIRLLRKNFPNLRFGLLLPNDISSMVGFQNKEQFAYWLGECIAKNDTRLTMLTKSYMCRFAYATAIANGSSLRGARRNARRAHLKL